MKQGNEPFRIGLICMELADLWANHPELRLGQIFSNAATQAKMEKGCDIFYMPDEDIMEILRKQLKSTNKEK
jgi:hypothetical protein